MTIAATDPPGTLDTADASGRAVFARMGRNVAWLLGGRGFQGVVSLVYLAIAARAMGPHGFGAFTLVLAYGQTIAGLAQFQSWQGVIRYGALHMAEKREDRLSRLLGFTATLDLASAVGGALVAAVGVAAAGPWLSWTIAEQHRAALFGAALLLSIGATPTGILRLLDRFDLVTYCQAVGPAVRFVGSIAIWLTGGGVEAFLVVWAAGALIQSAATWATALGRAGRKLTMGRAAFTLAVQENSGIRRFMLVTNASSTLSLLLDQVGTLAVGGVSGATAAGGYRLASKIAKSLVRPVQTLARVLYPELARLVASRDHDTLHGVVRRTNLIALTLAIAIVLAAGFGGPLVLQLFAGKAYRFAHVYLVVLALAAAIDLSGFSLEPLLTAHGRAGTVLVARAIAAVGYVAVMAALLPAIGPMGAAVAMVASSLVVRVLLGGTVARLPDERVAATVTHPTSS